jgi:propane 2-monooxygenase small subunit
MSRQSVSGLDDKGKSQAQAPPGTLDPNLEVAAKSGAAGAAEFPGSKSRKFNYYDPKGKRATHYEDVTVDVQPDPDRYLIQGWIISNPQGEGAYLKEYTAAKSSNWHKYRAPDQEWEKTHYQRQSKIVAMVQNVIANGRAAGAPKTFDANWVKLLQTHVSAWAHAEFGLGTSLMQAQRYGYTQMINNATLTNSSYKMRFSQDIVLYLGELGMDLEGMDQEAGKRAWLEDQIWQPAREAIENIMGSTDYLEQWFAVNICFEPLVGEVFRSGFLMHAAPSNRDFMTPAVFSSAEADYQRNLANSMELFHMLAHDEEYGAENKELFQEWLSKHVTLAASAARSLQPIWSEPSSKPVQFVDSFEAGKTRFNNIIGEIGLNGAPAEAGL